MKTHTRSGVMGRKRIRDFSLSLRLQQYTYAFCVFQLLSTPSTHSVFFSWPVRFGFSCGASNPVPSLWYALMDDRDPGQSNDQRQLPLYEAVFQSFSMSPTHLESDTKGKRVHSCLHLGTRLLRSSWRRHPPCHGNKAKETGGGSKIAQNPYV